MLLDDVKNAINGRRNGTYLTLQKTKDLGRGLVKVSNIVIRIGCAYGNIGAVVEKHSDGWTPQSLPYGHWVDGYVNLLIEHNGNYYLRVSNDYCNRNSSTYLLDGVEITKDQAIGIVGEKKLKSGNPDVYNIKIDNIVAIL